MWQIDDEDITGLSHEEVIERLKAGGMEITIKARRPRRQRPHSVALSELT